jgi:hypothetical protein
MQHTAHTIAPEHTIAHKARRRAPRLALAACLTGTLLIGAWLPRTAGAAPAPATALPTTPAAPTVPAGPAVTLRYKFTPGQILRYQMVMDTDGHIQMGEAGGTDIPLKDHMVIVERQTVKSVRPTDGAATLESHVESVTGTANGQPLPPAATSQMQNQTTTMVLTPTGKVLSMQMPGGMPMAGMGNITQSGTEAALPLAPVHVGDTWNSAASVGGIGTTVDMASTLTGLDTAGGGALATIAETIHGKFQMSPPGLPVAMTAQGTMNGTGTLHFDNVAGAVQDQTSTMTMDMTMTPPAAGASGPAVPPQLAHMHMHMHMIVHMTRLPAAP